MIAMTKERKIYLAVFLVAMTALAVDRLMVPSASGPADASAQAPQATAPGELPQAIEQLIEGSPLEAQAPTPTAALTQRLDSVASAWDLKAAAPKDVFVPGQPWQQAQEAQQAAETPDPAELFGQAHQLCGVMLSGGGKAMAIVDDKCLAIGETVGEFRLESVTADTATFVASDSKVVLRIAPEEMDGTFRLSSTTAP